jgi:hypothetical protein
MKQLIRNISILMLFCFPFLLEAQVVYDTIDIKYVNDSTWRIRRTLIHADGSDEPKGTLIATDKSQVLNVAVNGVVDISREYSNKLIEVLKGLPFRSMLNRYNEIERVLPDSSVFIKLNQIFPLEQGAYEVLDLRSGVKFTWTVSFNSEDHYFYMTTQTNETYPIYITSNLHFRVGVVFDFIKTDKDTWMSLDGYLLKKKE